MDSVELAVVLIFGVFSEAEDGRDHVAREVHVASGALYHVGLGEESLREGFQTATSRGASTRVIVIFLIAFITIRATTSSLIIL